MALYDEKVREIRRSSRMQAFQDARQAVLDPGPQALPFRRGLTHFLDRRRSSFTGIEAIYAYTGQKVTSKSDEYHSLWAKTRSELVQYAEKHRMGLLRTREGKGSHFHLIAPGDSQPEIVQEIIVPVPHPPGDPRQEEP